MWGQSGILSRFSSFRVNSPNGLLYQTKQISMRKIKIRFVARLGGVDKEPTDYLIQKKTFLGWKYIKYTSHSIYGGSVDYLYCSNTKSELLDKVLKEYFKTCTEFISIKEYQTIKLY